MAALRTAGNAADEKASENPDDSPPPMPLHSIENEDEVIELAYQLIEKGEVYGSIALNKGVGTLSNSLRERAATMGVVAALVASMIYPNVLQPYEVDEDSELFINIAVVCWTVALTSTIITVAISTHQIALISAFLSTDADIIRFVIERTAYIDSPDYLLAVALISTLAGIICAYIAMRPLWVSITCAVIFVATWIMFGIQWKKGFNFFHSREAVNKEVHLKKRKEIVQSKET
eukprot:CAMPEP_0197058336 /NCGR_PEP_ID=MMETSP1384-20130603/106604_1 /TAXON_ID=29189 /ORGANISM="Ammonia sp." /LENGTH=232 /DNA_ID=CAMNT_0042493051 /DNA_START=35 /DNA_END=733 /DNA_ORIENTATION=+